MSGDRLTVTEVARTLLARNTTDKRPAVSIERSAAPGSKGLIKIVVDVPVCDEFPSLALAFHAAQVTFDELCDRYPMPDVNGGEAK